MDRADPGDGGRWEGEMRLLVGLEEAEGVYVAPGVEDYDVGHEDLGPGCEASIWWRLCFIVERRFDAILK